MGNDYIRSDQLLKRKFVQYLIPTMTSYAALSLNGFLDSMIVSNSLGSRALAIVNLGTPLTLVFAAVYGLLGNGAAALYALSLGKRDHEGAGKSLTAAMVMALSVGLLIVAVGTVFFKPISGLLCQDAELMEDFNQYLRVQVLSAPLLTTLLTFTMILPSAGYPGYSMAINLTANFINIVMDIVYIRIMHIGVVGAAWSTITGYIAGLVLLVFLCLGKKIKMYVSSKIRDSLVLLKDVFKLGGPEAMTQVGFSLQFAFCNGLASSLAGTPGIVAIALCLQANSIETIFLGSVMGSSVPIMSVLHGQCDFKGQTSMLKNALKWQLCMSAVLSAIISFFAPQVAGIFSVTEPAELAVAVPALRFYCLMLFIRSGIILFFRYLKVIGFAGYAILISALDSFGVIIPVAWVLSRIFGITGLWMAFPTTALLILSFILIRNYFISSHSNGHYKGLLLFENDESAKLLLDVTIMDDADSIGGISEKMQAVCEENGIDEKKAMLVALAVEEMAVYITGKKDHVAYMDILVRKHRGNVIIDFRSLGHSFNPLMDSDEDSSENVRMLRGIASSIETEYTLGMNSTRIVIKKK